MRLISPAFCMAMVATGLLLAGCAQMSQQTARSEPPAAAADDDTYCRANGVAAGSPAYVACRKDRDVAAVRAGSSARMDRTHKNLAEDMLNGR